MLGIAIEWTLQVGRQGRERAIVGLPGRRSHDAVRPVQRMLLKKPALGLVERSHSLHSPGFAGRVKAVLAATAANAGAEQIDILVSQIVFVNR